MKQKQVSAFILFFAIQVLAVSLVFAQSEATTEISQDSTKALETGVTFRELQKKKLDDCRDMLPQVQRDYTELNARYQERMQGQHASNETYMESFNQMTATLFQLTEARELETAQISASRDSLRESLNRFNTERSLESTKALQEEYLNLTVRLYSSMMDSQKNLESLRADLGKVESKRNEYNSSKKEMEAYDHQRLALEAQLVSLQIRCGQEH